MSADVFTLNCQALTSAKLVGFKGTEYLSRPFQFDVFFTVPTATDVRAALGAPASLQADRGDGFQPMYWHGMFARLRLLHQTDEWTLYSATLVPRLWRLRHSIRSHVFTKQNIKEFLTDALIEGGMDDGDFDFRIDESSYPTEEFVCQYRESHLDFFNRWLEREGLYYFFEHEADDNGSESIVVVDDRGKHHPLAVTPPIRYFPAGSADVSASEGFHEFYCDYQSLPESVLVTDYNYENPAAPVQGQHAVSDTGVGQVRDYGYRVFDEGEAGRLATIKAQSMACREFIMVASGNAMNLRAGYTFEVEDLGTGELPSNYLAVKIRHVGVQTGTPPQLVQFAGLNSTQTYRVHVQAIPADVQYRATQATPWPRIYGFENAIVDGSAESQYAQIDDLGRYLVRFKFDASELSDGSASTYLRMAQPHGGTVEGWHFPLRKGTEVMVAFQGGDPDRPVISGVVPNAHQPSTVTSGNHTKNVLRTGGNSHIEIDDLDGQQYLQLYTPKECKVHMGGQSIVDFLGYDNSGPTTIETDYFMDSSGPAGFWVEGGWWEDITGTKNVHVTGNVTIGYDAQLQLDIKAASNEHFHNTRTTTIDGHRSDTVSTGGMEQHVTGEYVQTIGDAGGRQEVTGAWKHKVTGENHDEYGSWKTDVLEQGTWTATIGSDASVTSTNGNVHVESAAGTVTIKANSLIMLDAPEVKNTGAAKIYQETPFSVTLYGGQQAFGVQKLDICALALELNDFKFEAGMVNMCGYALQDAKAAAAFKAVGADIKNAATSIGNGALKLINAALAKIG